jgi:hypothetical protein
MDTIEKSGTAGVFITKRVRINVTNVEMWEMWEM